MQFLDTLRRLYSLDYDTSYALGYGLLSEFEPDSVTMVYLASALAMFQPSSRVPHYFHQRPCNSPAKWGGGIAAW
jgi:hypothetical protein